MTYTKTYASVIRYMKSPWELFKQRMEAEPDLRWGTHPEGTEIRPIMADAYQDATGDEQGAAIIRHPYGHFMLNEEGKPVYARFNLTHINHLVGLIRDHMDEQSMGAYEFPLVNTYHAGRLVTPNVPPYNRVALSITNGDRILHHDYVSPDRVGPITSAAIENDIIHQYGGAYHNQQLTGLFRELHHAPYEEALRNQDSISGQPPDNIELR